jgi:2-isopropylmalate synthase
MRLTSGEDAQAEVHVSIECEATKERINGIGVDFDVLQASAEAYTQASAILKEKGERK